VPPWLERVLGRSFLALGLGFHLMSSSLEMAFFYVRWPASRLAAFGLPLDLIEQLQAAPAIEPFLFLPIPLVLLAWGYGRRGALLRSTGAALLHLRTGLWSSSLSDSRLLFLAQKPVRIALLYLVPLLVSLLAEREREQHSQLQVAHQRLRRHVAADEQLATSHERNRLATNLHDKLAHSPPALTVQLEALRTLLAHDPQEAMKAHDEASAVARNGLEDSRQAILALRTGPAETLGLDGALRDVLQSLQARTGVEVSLTVAGETRDLTLDEARSLFRIAEEALTNVERHAAARQVTVRLAFGINRTNLVVCDDGVGFDFAAVEPQRYGLTGMQERVAMIGASLQTHTRAGGGTEAWCSLAR
jgi:signal transduction histidine kinase